MERKPILAFDCATPHASVALMLSGDEVDTCEIERGQQAAQLVPVIDRLMKQRGISYQDLTCMLSTRGPGSFTGLRIGLATLHGLALATKIPVKLISSLEAMAWEYATRAPDHPLTIAMHAGKGELFTQQFSFVNGRPQPENEIAVIKPHLLPEQNVAGNVLAEDHPYFIPGPSAVTLCRIAHQLTVTPLAEALPLYIRPPDAKIPAKPEWLTA